jgi:methylenetetrahydrofolate dehydrogenase (NADP+) / methenyltetrahydrofolate cyclohydrolase
MSQLIDGKARAKQIREGLKSDVSALNANRINPKLSVILVGDDPASKIYVSNKEKACVDVGIISDTHRLPATANEAELIKLIQMLNNDRTVHGILVQLPLPAGLSAEKVVNTISQFKDVDGLGIQNSGLLIKGEGDPMVPCTPQGVIDLIKSTGIQIKGKRAVVVGRSNLVGKPAAILLLSEHATITICHSRTVDLGSVTKEGDILVAAIGKPKIITKEMVKPGAVVIDVGMVKTAQGWSGDVDFEKVKDIAGFITPVPGGVGPMTTAMLMKNTIKAAKLQHNL